MKYWTISLSQVKPKKILSRWKVRAKNLTTAYNHIARYTPGLKLTLIKKVKGVGECHRSDDGTKYLLTAYREYPGRSDDDYVLAESPKSPEEQLAAIVATMATSQKNTPQKTAWNVAINALRLHFLQGNSHIDNISTWIDEQVVETLNKIRQTSTRKDTATIVVATPNTNW